MARVPLADAQDRLRELLEDKWAASSHGTAGSGTDSGAGSASAA